MKDDLDRNRKPELRRSLFQLANSVIPYLALWGAMIWSLQVSYWLTLALSVLAAGFLVRIFIIFHDCGHGSFFKSSRANRIAEFFTGVMVLTPFRQWSRQHAQHHATSGDLDRRGFGDVWTMTTKEYLAASRGERFGYHINRNPFVLFVVAPIYVFFIRQRLPAKDVGPREHRGLWMANAAIAAVAVTMGLLIGFKEYFMIQIPVMFFGGVAGIWLFYVQHQYENVYWARHDKWDYTTAALQGSSFYMLPKVLQWFSGNIGFHHVHHLNSRIPNYKLEECHLSDPVFQDVTTLTLRSSFKSIGFRLWDEDGQRMTGYAPARALRRAAAAV
ncbi:MAG TPA: fatty acid desaturase [Planctomycetota bacterium]